MGVGEAVDVIEGFSFAWEIFGICAFVCEESVQACTLGIASALNRGRVELAELGLWLLEEGIVDIYVMYNIFILGFGYPPAFALIEFLNATFHLIGDSASAVESVEAMPGRSRYPFFLPYGRFF
jgi:hypothetical protein